MAQVTESTDRVWTAEDLFEQFGPIPLNRVLHDPPPGSATEEDVVRLHDHQDRLCELVDGVLLEKTVGAYESYLAVTIARFLGNFVDKHKLGIVLGADGMMRLIPGLVRIPDVSFITFDLLPGGKVPRTAFAELAPDLAVEVISKSNTKKEMANKLREYFDSGVRLVWYVYPQRRELHVHKDVHKSEVLTEFQTLDGNDVLPGFELDLENLFAEPKIAD